ncbi:hypothetical protein Ccrd_002172, partial [Cynara cardunculus var. scolymus]
DALTQLLDVRFFGDIEDHLCHFQLTPWVKGFEKEIYGFLLSWFLLDMFMSFGIAVDAWVAMVDSKKEWKGSYQRSLLMVHPAINLKCLEGILCGSFARWVLLQSFGKLFASAFQSFMESMDANSSGQPFGGRELEVLLE